MCTARTKSVSTCGRGMSVRGLKSQQRSCGQLFLLPADAVQSRSPAQHAVVMKGRRAQGHATCLHEAGPAWQHTQLQRAGGAADCRLKSEHCSSLPEGEHKWGITALPPSNRSLQLATLPCRLPMMKRNNLQHGAFPMMKRNKLQHGAFPCQHITNPLPHPSKAGTQAASTHQRRCDQWAPKALKLRTNPLLR